MPKIIQDPERLILSVARELIQEKGYSAMNIRAISKKSGVSIGTFYNYFSDKSALDYKVMLFFWKGYEENVKIILDSDASILNQINDCYETLKVHLGQFLELFSVNRAHATTQRCMNPDKNALISRVSKMLSDRLIETCVFDTVISADEVANFIINTHVQMASYQIYEYELFEKVLEKLLVVK
ncbi:TetR/AcrR family transcriptional regulator [Fusibacter ferrireducens]|uniref:TetR/AcrR family transcriptional regulator n=1 Tax=Fusibacter ferrireducens TaxID=2785058 RepID=A0ABR9ZVD8_9FIRM|nr:TetR/AcrR family transcriptional regulator [Fusibacter ferrireducens]MBF4693574.1 TetR/AcrR family transcriptional regulator [Fusibacter ferrireducens]